MVTAMATNEGDLSNADFNNDIYGYLISLCVRVYVQAASIYSLKNSTRTQSRRLFSHVQMKFNQLCHLFRFRIQMRLASCDIIGI